MRRRCRCIQTRGAGAAEFVAVCAHQIGSHLFGLAVHGELGGLVLEGDVELFGVGGTGLWHVYGLTGAAQAVVAVGQGTLVRQGGFGGPVISGVFVGVGSGGGVVFFPVGEGADVSACGVGVLHPALGGLGCIGSRVDGGAYDLISVVVVVGSGVKL